MKTTTSQSRKSAFILAGSIAALLAVQSVRASTTINPGDTFDIDNSNTTATGNTTTFNDAGSMTIFNGGTLQVHPGQNDNIPFSNNLIFTGTAGTISLKFNNNDTDYRFNGPITSTATGAQTLAIETGFQGNGDRESVTFVQGIPDSGVDPLSLNVRFNTQSGSQSYVNLNGNNSFTGPITLVKGENVTSAYLTIGGVFTRNGNNPNDGVQGSGKLGGGSYAGAISLDTNTILNYYSSATQTLSGDISGAGSVMQSGDGLLTLSGNNTYTGATTIWSGKTLVIGGGSNTTSGVANDGVLSFNHVGAVSFSAPISGSGSVKKQGVGALTLAGSSTYSGGTTVENGKLSLSQDASLGAASGGLVVKGGTVEATSSFTLDSSRNLQLGAGAIISVSPSSTLSYNGTVANAPAVTGSLTKSGAGTLVLGGADSYTGLTSVNSGQLIATNGSALGDGGGLSVSSSATFAYKPMAPGALNLGSGSLTLANNSTIGTALSGTASQSVISTSGAASVSGNVTVNIFVGNTFTPGVNNLITAAGGLIAGSPSYAVQIYNDTNFAISGLTVTNTAISVNASNVAAYADLHWKGGYNGGDNVWALSNGNNQSNWATNSGGGTRTGQVAGPTTTVHLSASGATNQGAMVLGADMSVAGVVASDTTPMTLQADGNKLTVGSSGITVNAGATVTIATPVVLGAGQSWTNNSVNPLSVSGAVSGGGNLTKTGSGTVILSSSQSTYTGATAVTGGTLAVGDGTGALPTLATSGITLSNNANLTLNHTGTASFSPAITGTGSVTKAGSGTLRVTSAQAYNGDTIITGGELKLQGVTAAPPVADFARWFDASDLGLSNGASVTQWNDGSTNAANATVPGGNQAPTYIANAGTGTGLGALHFNAGGGAGDSGALNFNRDNTIRTVFSIFKGSSFLLTDTDAYNFHRQGDSDPTDPLWNGYASDNIRSGTTYVNSVPVNGESFSMPTNLHNGYNLVEVLTTGNVQADGFNKDRSYHAGDQSQAEVIIYDRLLTEAERHDVENYLNNKWFVGGGVGADLLPVTTAVTMSSGTTLNLAGINQRIASLTDVDPAPGATTGHRVLLGSATLTVGNGVSTVYSGAVSGSGGLTKVGAGRLTLAGALPYTGATNVTGGTLEIGDGGNLPAFSTSGVTLANNANITFNHSNAASFSQAVSGVGSLNKDGNGMLTLTTSHTYTGATVIRGGTLKLAGTAAVGSASYATTSNPTFSPAANNLILGLAPSAYSNGAEGEEGTGPISLLTNGATPTGNPDTYYIGDNATITYRLPVSTLGYNLSAINIYSGWNDDGRENITLNNISFSTVGTPLIFTPINGSSVNFEANADTGLARLTSTGGVLVAGVYAVRFNFGNQENGAVGYREIEVLGVPAGAGSNVLPVKTPVVLDSNTTLNLNNVSQRIASLADMDPTPGNTTGHTVVLGGATLTIGDPTNLSTAETIFSGDITSTTLHASAVEKVGPSVQTLNGAQTYDTLIVTAGTLNINGELGTTPANGTATVDVADGAKLQFGNLSQTLSSLTIGDGATVTFTSGMAFGALSGGGGKSPAFGGTAAVPEPGSLGLLLVGALGVLNRRRREA